MNQFLAILIFLYFSFIQNAIGQDIKTQELHFEVNKINPAFSVSKVELENAHTLIDLNPHYKSSWVLSYISVEITTINNSKTNKSIGNNDVLNDRQKVLINSADTGTDIKITVKYIPENNLKNNDPKTTNFTLKIIPDNDAKFVGGIQSLNAYLDEYAISKIPKREFNNIDLTTVKFTIDEDGQIVDAHVFWPSKNESVDTLMLEAICNMPSWSPASFNNGLKVKQEYVLTLGNMESCVIPLLNIKNN